MNNLFNYDNQELFVLTRENVDNSVEFVGEILFRANDIARILGYANPRDAILKQVSSDDKVKVKNKDLIAINKKVNNAGETFVTESGMYSLVFNSTLDSSKKFKQWVTAEVLPTIRKTGVYGVNKPATISLGSVIEEQLMFHIEEILDAKLKNYKVKEVEELVSLFRAYGMTKKKAGEMAHKTLKLNSSADSIFNGYLQDQQEEDVRRQYGQVKAYVRELVKLGYDYQQAWTIFSDEILFKTGYDLAKEKGTLMAKGNKKATLLDAAYSCGVTKDAAKLMKQRVNREIKRKNKLENK
jgi:prophage antirepressor-like protein